MMMETKIRIADIINDSIVDGPGIRLVIFTQGCRHFCQGCHNPSTHPLDGGKLIEITEIVEMAKSNPLLDGVTISGGEPFLQVSECLTLLYALKPLSLNIIFYTGYRYEDLWEIAQTASDLRELLAMIDILVDGKFELANRDISLKFRGSSNQRVIDVQKSLKQQQICEVDWD